MAFFAGAIAIGGLAYHYCSITCMQKSVNKSMEEVLRGLRDCPNCAEENVDDVDEGETMFQPGAVPVQREMSFGLTSNPRSRAQREMNVELTGDRRSPVQQQMTRQNQRLGRITNSPFLNFMSEFRQTHGGPPCQRQTELAKQGTNDEYL